MCDKRDIREVSKQQKELEKKLNAANAALAEKNKEIELLKAQLSSQVVKIGEWEKAARYWQEAARDWSNRK